MVEDLTGECVVKAKSDTRVLKTKAREGGKRTGGGARGKFAVCRNAAVRQRPSTEVWLSDHLENKGRERS